MVPESEHQDTVGPIGRTVRDVALAFDAIWGPDPLNNYTLVPENTDTDQRKTFVSYCTDRVSLTGADFGLPWESFWVHLESYQQTQLLEIVNIIRDTGVTVINGTEIEKYETLVSPSGQTRTMEQYAAIRTNQNTL